MADKKILEMVWSPMKFLLKEKRVQFRYTDANNNNGFILYYTDNGVDQRRLVEHAFFYPTAVESHDALNDVEKAQCFVLTLLPPASAIYSRVLMEQIVAGVNSLEDILKAYIDTHMGEHGQRAVYRQLEGLCCCKKPHEILCFE